jgi:hypothetical protein
VATHLGLVEGRLFDFVTESLGDGCFLKNAVLTVQQPILEGEFSEREAYDEALPWEERPV